MMPETTKIPEIDGLEGDLRVYRKDYNILK